MLDLGILYVSLKYLDVSRIFQLKLKRYKIYYIKISMVEDYKKILMAYCIYPMLFNPSMHNVVKWLNML